MTLKRSGEAQPLARKWWTLLVACVATFMLLLDVTVVNVALPDIRSDLGGTFTDMQWVVPLPPGAAHRLGEAVSSGGTQAATGAAPPGARAVVAEAARRAFIEGLNEILIVAAIVAFTGGVLAFALVRSRDFVAHQAPTAA